MRSILRWLWAMPVLALGGALFWEGSAQELLAPAKGSVLILQTERTLEGEIQRKGKQYHIRRGLSEITIPGDSVLRLCQDWDEAVTFMKSRTDLRDPDECKRLAKWCHVNKLLEYALAFSKSALEMRPQDQEAKQLVIIFEREVANQVKTVETANPIKTAPVPQVDINQESLNLFSSKVQIILLNNCVHCHSAGKGGDFQLYRSHEGGQRQATQRNLAAALAQVNVDYPQLSPLLLKAVNLHGNQTQAAIRGRKTIPFQTLQDWVTHVVANNPQLHDRDWQTPKVTPAQGSAPPRETPTFPENPGTFQNLTTQPAIEQTSAVGLGGGMIVSPGYPPLKAAPKPALPQMAPYSVAPATSRIPLKPTVNQTAAVPPMPAPWTTKRLDTTRSDNPVLSATTQLAMPAFPENAVGLPVPRSLRKTSPQVIPAQLPAFPAPVAAPTRFPEGQTLVMPPAVQSAPVPRVSPPAAPGPSDPLAPDPYAVDEFNKQSAPSR